MQYSPSQQPGDAASLQSQTLSVSSGWGNLGKLQKMGKLWSIWSLKLDRSLSAKLVPTFAERGCHVASVTDPYGHILGFLDQASDHWRVLNIGYDDLSDATVNGCSVSKKTWNWTKGLVSFAVRNHSEFIHSVRVLWGKYDPSEM
jgi:hypothetical protein